MRDITATIEVDGAAKLGIGLGGGGKAPGGQALSSLLKSRGCLVSGDRVEEWKLEGVADRAEGLYVYGPAFAGKSLDSLVVAAGGDRAAALAAVARAARALEAAAARGLLPAGLSSAGILLGLGAEALILPPESAGRALRSASDGAEVGAAGLALAWLRSPKADGAAAEAAFLAAQAAYRAASGESAYRVPEAPKRGDRAAKGRGGTGRAADLVSGGFLPLALLRPELDPELARVIDESLAKPEAGSLARLRAALDGAEGRGWERRLTEGESDAASRRLGAARASLESRRRREAFFRERRALVVGVSIGLVVAVAAALTAYDIQRGKPDFSKLTARELVETYYRSIDALDVVALEACAPRRGRKERAEAIKQDSNYVSTMTVVSKTRQAYEGKDPIVMAEAWIAAGKPALDPDRVLFGISGLAVAELSAAPDRATYAAEYSAWTLERRGEPGEARAEAAPPLPLERRLRDELSLARDPKKGWRITGIVRTER